MSIKIMSVIFATEPRDLKDAAGNVTKASTVKLVLLALADHARDDGGGAYPSLGTMEHKTGLSRQTIVNVYKALRHHGMISLAGRSKSRTHNYTIHPNALPGTCEEHSGPITSRTDASAKPLDESSRLTDIGKATLPIKLPDESSHLTDVGQATLPVKLPDESSHLTDVGQATLPVKLPDESSHLTDISKATLPVNPLYQSSRLTDISKATLPSSVKPLDLNHPLTTIKPSDEEEEARAHKLRQLHFSNFGIVPPLLLETFRKAARKFTNKDWYEPAFQIAVNNGARSWRYVETVLDDWLVNGFGHKPERATPIRRYSRDRSDPTTLLLEYIKNGG